MQAVSSDSNQNKMNTSKLKSNKNKTKKKGKSKSKISKWEKRSSLGGGGGPDGGSSGVGGVGGGGRGQRQRSRKVIVRIQPGTKWYDLANEDVKNPQNECKDSKGLSKAEIEEFEKTAVKLLETDVVAYRDECMKGEDRADFIWMDRIMQTGTLPDRMAAFTVRIQDAPVHNLKALQHLLAMVKVQGKQQCLMTSDSARDLFLQDLLPPGRKLVPFHMRGSALKTGSQKQLILWIFEDRLKTQYGSFIEALRLMSIDTVDKMRGKAISVVQELLTAHPEQENILLPMLVNKLGDPIKKIGSRALFHLSKLLDSHPLMKLIVVEEVERLLFRNNISKKAQYYGICFLNNIKMEHNGTEGPFAVKLIKVFLAFFKACVKTGEIDSKLMSGILTGINKTIGVAQLSATFEDFNNSFDTLFKIVHLSQFHIGVQALSLLYQLTLNDVNRHQTDRFYRVLYEHLQNPEFLTTSHSLLFLNVVFKAMRRDSELNRVISFAKRLLQICTNAPANLACGALYLISEVTKVHKRIILTGETPSNPHNGSETDPDLKDEPEADQEISQENRKTLEDFMKTSNVRLDVQKKGPQVVEVDLTKEPTGGSAVANQPLGGVDEDEDKEIKVEVKSEPDDCKEEKFKRTDYDPLARNPLYSGAELTLAYELSSLAQHCHPSVAHFAQSLLDGKCISYDGNPMKDFTLGRFLERFVYKNPKSKKFHAEYQPKGLRNVPVNSETYLKADESKIPIEERFFYKYFKSKGAPLPPKQKKDEDDSDIESVDDEEFDEIMGNYFHNKGGAEMSDDDEDEEDVDFSQAVNKKKGKGTKRKLDTPSDDEDSEFEQEGMEEDDEENEPDFDGPGSDVDEFVELNSDDEPEYDGEDGDFGDDFGEDFDMDMGDDEDGIGFAKAKKLKNKPGKSKNDNMFAPAEKFSEMLESNADFDMSTPHTLVNKDNADPRQLKWEMERHRWVKGYKKNSRIRLKSNKGKK